MKKINTEAVNKIIDLTFHRLNIPLNPKDTTPTQTIKVILINKSMSIISYGSVLLGIDSTLEAIRAVCDCIELSLKEGIEDDKS